VRLVRLVLSGIAAAVFANSAVAADVAYSFSTGVVGGFFSSDGSSTAQLIRDQLSGSSVSGSFVYDATSPATGTTTAGSSLDTRGTVYSVTSTTPPFHSSFNTLAATVAGAAGGPLSFTDPRGFTIVGNDAYQGGCGPQPCSPPPLADYFQFQAESSFATGTHNIVPFSVVINGTAYDLFNARLFWIEGVTGPFGTPTGDFLSSNDLLATPPSLSGRLALDFVAHGNAAGPQYDVFFEGLAVTAAVPEPEIYAMLVSGFGLLGFFARRRKLQK
jgi:PEP-CTERM motif